MVATPWGDADSLRARKLPPGRGIERREVERNQRERIYGALVATVARKGYAATSVADLVELSGVSSRTFYQLFAGKRACFLGALEAMINAALVAAETKMPGGEMSHPSWEDRARRGADVFAKLIGAQPAAARMALIEAYAAGPEAVALLERAGSAFEELARHVLAQSPERAGITREMVSAYIGAIQEITRMRLLQGRETDLPGLIDDLWRLVGSYRTPPEPLRLSERVPTARTESLQAQDHAERALRGLAVVAAEQGYARTTVSQVVRRASMSTTTFYKNFRDKDDAMLAAIDAAGAQMMAAALPAIRRAPDWATGVRVGFGELFNFLASRPALARLVAVEVYAAGPAALERRMDNFQLFEALLTKGQERSSKTPAIAAEAIAGVVYALTYRTIQNQGPRALPDLAPICTYIVLAPSMDAEQACAAANGGRTRQANLSGLDPIPA